VDPPDFGSFGVREKIVLMLMLEVQLKQSYISQLMTLLAGSYLLG